MTTSGPSRRVQRASDRRLRSFFRLFNRFMLWMWRIGLGPWINAWPAVGGRIMVLTHTGRRSRLARQTPVNYAPVGETLYCTAGRLVEIDGEGLRRLCQDNPEYGLTMMTEVAKTLRARLEATRVQLAAA